MNKNAENNKQRVLFIDDEVTCCEIFSELMSDYYETTTCINPIKAIEILKSKQFDAIVSDQNMPEMRGTELFKKAAAVVPDVAMIALTGLSETELIHKAINNGEIFYFIKKPWEQNEMHSIIQSAIKDKQAKLKLVENEKLIKASFEQATVGFAHLNPDGSFIRINNKFSEILQLPEQLILSNNIYNLITPKDRIRNGIKIANLLEHNKNCITYEINFIQANYNKVICKLTLSVVRDPDKQPLFIVAMIEDITEQKLNEKELLISHELLRQIPLAVLVTNLDGKIIRWIGDANKIFGFKEDEMIGNQIDSLFTKEKRKEIFDLIFSQINTNDHFIGEIKCIKKDGCEISIETRASKVIDQLGDPMAIISIHQDITDRKRVLSELKEYKENLEDMVSKRTKDIEFANEELNKRTKELEKFNKAMVGRELKIIKLKEEVNNLSLELGKEIPYPPVWENNNPSVKLK